MCTLRDTGGSEKDVPQYGNSLHIAGCDDPIGNCGVKLHHIDRGRGECQKLRAWNPQWCCERDQDVTTTHKYTHTHDSVHVHVHVCEYVCE